MYTILVNRLEDKACPLNVWLGKLTVLDMTPLGWLGRKTSTQTNQVLLTNTQIFFFKHTLLNMTFHNNVSGHTYKYVDTLA